MNSVVKTKKSTIPTVWKQAAGLLRVNKKKNQSEIDKNRTDWAIRLKHQSSL